MVLEKTKILIIDDDPWVHQILKEGLPKYNFVSAHDGSEGLQMVTTEKPELILLDIRMPGISGLEILEKLAKLENRPEVIMISGHAETEYVVQSMKLGAAEFITKPLEPNEVEIHIAGVIERIKLRGEVTQLKRELQVRNNYSAFIGDSDLMTRVKTIIEQVAPSELTVLIRGESGTGKEIAARMLHTMSGRRNQEFVKVNCAAIPRDLLEAELFGYEKGAFTGAHKTKQGRFEIANKGTIFLDEIGDMPLELQSKLLQVLEQQEFVRVGGITNIHVDVRIICATNRNLEQAIADRGFRDDLFYRLNEISLFLPPLRDRREDVSLLVEHFITKYSTVYQREAKPLAVDTIKSLTAFDWPGNVRQLENMIKQVVVRNDEAIISELIAAASQRLPLPAVNPYSAYETGNHMGGPVAPDQPADFALKNRVGKTIASEEKRLIAEVLQKTNWNRRKAAEILKISYRSLLYKIKDYNLNATK
jgi:DNA-binding NtrC family response regulator